MMLNLVNALFQYMQCVAPGLRVFTVLPQTIDMSNTQAGDGRESPIVRLPAIFSVRWRIYTLYGTLSPPYNSLFS